MKTQFLWKRWMLFIVFLPIYFHSYAQKDMCSPHISKRSAELDQKLIERPIRIVDQYGNEFLPSDITPSKSRGSRSGCNPNSCVAGLFTLNFQDAIISSGVGFDNCTPSGGSTVGQLRQAIVCQVFRDLSNLLYDVSGGTNNGRVNIWIHSDSSYAASIGAWPSGVGGLNSAFYVLPNGLNNVVLDNEIWKTIRGGINSYTSLPPAFNPSGSTGLYHGLIAIGFSGSSWNLNLDIQNPTSFTDLYEVVLHEAIHGLGFGSLVASNGSSKLGADMYSRYDTYLRLNSTPLISFTPPNNWNYTGGLANLGINCNSSQLFNFNGASLSNQAVYTQSAWSNGTNLSHFGCDLANGSICSTAYAQPASDYVMNPCAGLGPNFTKRHPNLSEVRSLCDMGYRLKVSGGNATYGDAPSLSPAAETYILSTFADCSGACVATGYTDNFTTAFDQNITINHSSILANDKDNSGGALTTGTVNFPILYTPAAGTLTLNAGNFIFDPAPTFSGTAVIGYYPRCNGSTTNGSLTFVFVNVGCAPLPSCSLNNSCRENLVLWGDMNVFANQTTMRNAIDFNNCGTSAPFQFNDTVNSLIQDNTPDFYTGGSVWSCSGGSSAILATGSTAVKLVVRRINNSLGVSCNVPEGGAFKLCKGVPPGATGTISFLAATPTPCTTIAASIRAEFTTSAPISGQNIYTTPGIVPGMVFTTPIISSTMSLYTYNFTNTSAQTLNYVVISSFIPANNAPSPPYAGIGGIVFDSLSLFLTGQDSMNITATPSTLAPFTGCDFTINYQICNPRPTTSAAFNLQIQLPAGLTHIPNGSFPTLSVTVPALASGTCTNLTLSIHVDNNNTLAGIPLSVQAIPQGSICFKTNQSVTTVTPRLYPLTFTKSASTITPVNGVDFTFNFEVCNVTGTTQSITLTDVVPANLTIVNTNGWVQSGQTLTRGDNLDPGTVSYPFCKQYSFTVQPNITFSGATQCNYQSASVTNTASAQFKASPCNPITSSVTLTVFSHRVVGSAVNIPTISQAVAQGMLLPGTGAVNSTNTTQTFTIAGNLAVDMDYQFGNSSTIVHSYAWCAPGAAVNVNDYKKLSGYYLDFNACSQMWKGITVAGRYILFNWEGELVLDHCQINDAQYGVKPMNMSKLSLTNNQFRECFVGIYLPDHSSTIPSSPSVVLNLPLAGNVFYSAGNMKAAYPGMANSGQQPTVGSIPATNRRTWAGIQIEGWSSLAVGTTSGGYSANSFTGISNGIVSDNADLNVVGSFFDQHRAYGYSFGAKQGNAIYCSAYLQLVIGGPPSAGKGLYQRGNGFNTSPYICNVSIGNSDFGIVASGMNVDIANNCFSTVGTGVSVTGAKYGTIRVNNNNFSTSNGAISLVNNDPVNITDIGPNTILNSGGLTALTIQEQNNPPVQYTTVHNNIVIMSGNTWVGLNINGCTGVAGLISSFNVRSNTIVMQNPASHLYGMSISNSHVIDAFLNSIGGDTWISPATQNSTFSGYPVAMSLSASDGRFFCDSTFRLYNGVKIFGTCLTSEFFGNVMNTHTYGFYLTSGATLQAQGSSTISRGNKWRGSFTGGNAARNDNGTTSNIFVQGTAAPYWPAAVGTVSPSSGWILSSTGSPYQCGAVVYGAGYGGFKKEDEKEQELSEAEMSVIKNEMRFNDFEASLKWQNEKVVFEKLKSSPVLIGRDNETGMFYDAQHKTALAELSTMDAEKNTALQIDLAKRSDFNRLSAEKESLIAQLVDADKTINDKSAESELNAWRSAKAQIQQKIDIVNEQLAILKQAMNGQRLQRVNAVSLANEQIATTLLIERNQKLLNSIYLNTVAVDKYVFTDEQLKSLKDIAGQCPLEGGEAVYRSRSLLSLVSDTFYDDYAICKVAAKKEGESKKNQLTEENLVIRTMPNPVNDYVVVQSNISMEEMVIAIVYDNLGRVVLEQPLSLSGKRASLNTQLLQQGLYHIKVLKGQTSVYSGKFNVIH